MNNTIVIDTNLLMHYGSDVIKDNQDKEIIISLVSLEELDNLKTKPGIRGYLAREGIRIVKKYQQDIEVDVNTSQQEALDRNIEHRDKHQNDNAILSCAIRKKATLMTNDISLKMKAQAIGVAVKEFYGNEKYYSDQGWRNIVLEDEHLYNFYADFKKDQSTNYFLLSINEYAIITNKDGEDKDVYKWDGEKTIRIVPSVFLNSHMLGRTLPKDYYQRAAMDSLMKDDFTVLTGAAGTGKSLLALNYCFQAIERGEYKRINIFINPVIAKGTQDIGAYPGTREEKLLSKSLGSMLVGKLKSVAAIYKLIDEGLLRIYPMSEIRGLEINSDEILYMPEAQNTTVALAKLAIQRAAEGAKIIAEGDIEQSDNSAFASGLNGLKRYIEVFSGEHMFSRVNLPNIYRSEIANIAQEM